MPRNRGVKSTKSPFDTSDTSILAHLRAKNEEARRMAFNEITKIEPRLRQLCNEARKVKATEAYDVAYNTIYDQLPGCRDCSCIRLEGIATFRERMATN